LTALIVDQICLLRCTFLLHSNIVSLSNCSKNKQKRVDGKKKSKNSWECVIFLGGGAHKRRRRSRPRSTTRVTASTQVQQNGVKCS